jgi:hypothetical protein
MPWAVGLGRQVEGMGVRLTAAPELAVCLFSLRMRPGMRDSGGNSGMHPGACSIACYLKRN